MVDCAPRNVLTLLTQVHGTATSLLGQQATLIVPCIVDRQYPSKHVHLEEKMTCRANQNSHWDGA